MHNVGNVMRISAVDRLLAGLPGYGDGCECVCCDNVA